MEKNSEPSNTLTHMVKRFLTKVVRSFNGEKTLFPKTGGIIMLGELNIHMPRNEDQFSSVTQSCPTLCKPMDFSTADLPIHHQHEDFTQTHVHWFGDAIQPSHPLLIPSLPIFNLSSIRVFSNEVVHHIRWPKYWSFSFGISTSTKYSELIAFEMDSLDLLAVQGLSKVFFNTTVQKHQFSSAQLS